MSSIQQNVDYPYWFGLAEAHGLSIVDRRKTLRHATRRWAKRSVSDIHGLVVHQTAGGDSVSALAKYHTGKLGKVHIGDGKGLPGIAYTMFVDKAGELSLVNDVEDITWSHGDRTILGDENKMYMSVCFGGRFTAPGFDGTEHPTDAQIDVFHKVWAFTKDAFGLTDLDLYGHYDFGKAGCPGFDLQALIETYNAEVDSRLDTPNARQQALSDLGYDVGEVDGLWGKKSVDAMLAFMADHRLPRGPKWTRLMTAAVYRALDKIAVR